MAPNKGVEIIKIGLAGKAFIMTVCCLLAFAIHKLTGIMSDIGTDNTPFFKTTWVQICLTVCAISIMTLADEYHIAPLNNTPPNRNFAKNQNNANKSMREHLLSMQQS